MSLAHSPIPCAPGYYSDPLNARNYHFEAIYAQPKAKEALGYIVSCIAQAGQVERHIFLALRKCTSQYRKFSNRAAAVAFITEV